MTLSLRFLSLVSCLAVSVAATAVAKADAIPYPDSGTLAPTVPLTAAATGDVIGYFFSFEAADDDTIVLMDLTTGTTSSPEFPNKSTPVGQSANFGHVNAGDSLAFVLINNTTMLDYSTDPTLSADGFNHGYITSYSGTGGPAGIPAGTYVGMEDIFHPPSDLDYNDDTFVFTNVSAPTPEPSSFLLLGSGLLAAAGVIRRRVIS
jgi:hypothetical protein